MWFRLPEGATELSVEQQNFRGEVKDGEGFQYFRAPNHFAPKILSLPGFLALEPKDGPEDLPIVDPKTEAAVGELTQQLSSANAMIASLRADLNAAAAQNTALFNENEGLKAKLEVSEAKIKDLEEELEDIGPPATAALPLAKKK